METKTGDLRRIDELVHIVLEPFATIGFRAVCTEDNYYHYEHTTRIAPSKGPPTCLWCVVGARMPLYESR